MEVWVNGRWHYLGARELESVLNKDWFTYVANKAILVHSRVFPPLLSGGEITGRNGCVTEINHLAFYAEATPLTAMVPDENGRPATGAQVQSQILSGAKLYPVATLSVDGSGWVFSTIGKSCLMVFASRGGLFGWKWTDLRSSDSVIVTLRSIDDLPKEQEVDFFPSEGVIHPEPLLSKRTNRIHRAKLKKTAAVRESRCAYYFVREKAEETTRVYPLSQDETLDFLQRTGGNRQEVERFLCNGEPSKQRVRMPETPSEKDLVGLNVDTLDEYLRYAESFEWEVDAELFRRYVPCPRIENEQIVPYRALLTDFPSTEAKEKFRHNPALVQRAIDERIDDCDWNYGALPTDPCGLLQMGFGSERSKSILSVATCRVLGIPARPDPVFGQPQFYTGSVWVDSHRGQSEDNASAVLLLRSADGKPLHYGRHFTVARLCGGVYQTLQCDANRIGKVLWVESPPSEYLPLTHVFEPTR